MFLPPHETVVRQGLIDAVRVKPRRIIDLGCGTGSTTLMLKQAFPEAEVVGLDLSPYMLVVADMKAQKAGLKIQWLHSIGRKRCFSRCQLRFSRIFLAVSRDAACCIAGNFARKLPTAEGWGTSGNFGRKPKNFAAGRVAD
jgi:SAM-dependent methyltransferase